ncbi:MAG: hypothetical protein JWR60_3469 [Polaromonas sp.]|nr:hypothetical protein [Polaromonas sp.]
MHTSPFLNAEEVRAAAISRASLAMLSMARRERNARAELNAAVCHLNTLSRQPRQPAPGYSTLPAWMLSRPVKAALLPVRKALPLAMLYSLFSMA